VEHDGNSLGGVNVGALEGHWVMFDSVELDHIYHGREVSVDAT
jgi:hypothetical protein